MRTSATQFQLLVEYMERNGDLSKPTEGPQGKATNLRMWAELQGLLNSDSTGDTKNIEKWRKVWSDLKNNTKKKSARIHRAAQKTGGGPASKQTLSDLEQRVLSIIGTQAATGIVEIPEVGLEEQVVQLDANDDSPSIFNISVQLAQQTCSIDENWDRPGTSAQPACFSPLANSNDQDLVGRAELGTSNIIAEEDEAGLTHNSTPAISRPQTAGARQHTPQTLHVVERNEAGVMHGSETVSSIPCIPTASTRQHAPQSPMPLPLTPRRRRRRQLADSSPSHRRTRTQKQSDLARQAFVRSDCEWRAFQQEAERERNRLRELEIQNHQRWLEIFSQFLALGNRVVDILEKKK